MQVIQSQSGLRFRPILSLGQGGMADVLLSVGRGPSGFNKLVVLKTMRKELITDDDLRQMFLAEARLSARLNHANVVHVYEVVEAVSPCIVMEYLEGQAMSALSSEAGDRFTLPMQLRVISDALAGLHYSHDLKDYDGTPLNIVHRDVSPQNVFITYDGQVKVLDFGIAKASNSSEQTRTGVIKGKITYMPREQLTGDPVDRRADVYAIGCMLWKAASGEKLWADVSERDVMRAIIEGTIPRPSTLRPVEPKLEAIVMKALAPEPEDRYPTAAALRKDVDQFLAEFYPSVTLRDVAQLMSEIFVEQQEARSKAIHVAMTAPHSEPPPPIPEGLEPIVSGVSTRSFVKDNKTQLMWSVLGAAVTAVLIVGGVVGFFAWRGRSAENPSASSSANAGEQLPAQIQVRLFASPAQAVFTVDGVTVSGNPATLTVTRDNADHEIRATLEGHEPVVRVVRYERDLSLEVQLTPVAPATSSVSATPEHAKTPKWGRAPVAPRPTGGGKKPAGDCDPPFYFDGNGIKVYKPGCL
jgi:serine/threonine-protein kinase